MSSTSPDTSLPSSSTATPVPTLSQSTPQISLLSPRRLRALILDYLVQRCYTRTARAFAADSIIRHLDADGDEIRCPRGEEDSCGITEEALHQADLRRGVQTSILSGRIDDAIDCLNANFPSTLPSSICADTESPTRTEPEERPQSKTVETVFPFTLEPAQLYLELRILAFIEASRTQPLPYPLAMLAASDPEPTTRISPPNNFRDPSGEVDGDAHLTRLLKHVREIYDCAQALQDPQERAEYQHELSNISSLLVYKVPEQSPMKKYMTQERREAVADQVNSAILDRAGCPSISYVELYVRYNAVIWNYMNEHGHRVVLSRGSPTGMVPTSRPQPTNASVPSGTKASVSRDEGELAPAFDLSQFLSS